MSTTCRAGHRSRKNFLAPGFDHIKRLGVRTDGSVIVIITACLKLTTFSYCLATTIGFERPSLMSSAITRVVGADDHLSPVRVL